MFFGKFFAFGMAIALSGCATEYAVSPVTQSGQQVRFSRGMATTYSEKKSGAVQITALGLNSEMRPAFQIAAFNKSGNPANFGVENVSLELADGSSDKIFTSGELIHEAKVNAEWAKVGTILVGALAAGAAHANAYSTTSGSISTPYGNASYYSRTYDPGVAYAGAAAAGAATGYGLARIQASLDETISNYSNQVLQTTTVDPSSSYGGVVVANSLSSSNFPETFAVRVSWNGDEHDFRFMVAKSAVPTAPPPAPAQMPAVFTSGGGDNSGAAALNSAPNTPPRQATFVSFDQWDSKKKAEH